MKYLHRMLRNDPDGKIYKFLSFSGSGRDIADPWYTGDFTATYNDVLEGCEGFLKFLADRGSIPADRSFTGGSFVKSGPSDGSFVQSSPSDSSFADRRWQQ